MCDVKALLVALAIVIVGCGDLQTGSRALAPSAVSASPTPLPSGVIDPKPLEQRASGLSASVHRVDKVSSTLTSRKAYMDSVHAMTTAIPDPDLIWVIAIIGELTPSFGLIDMGVQQCGLFGFDAFTGDGWMSTTGPLANCVPYFKGSITPPDEPVRCPAQPYDNGLPRDSPFTPTHAGDVPLITVRDDAWRQPTTVSGTFLMRAPAGSVVYQDAYCLAAVVRESPAKDTLRAGAVGARVGSIPPLDYAVWLRDLHALRASADGKGHIAVTLERRAGFEWAFFDWSKISTGASYVMFQFIDPSGAEMAPWRLFNGP